MGKKQFSIQLRSSIESEIIKQYDQLLNPTLEFLKKNVESYGRCTFENISEKNAPFGIDIESCINFILDSKTDVHETKFGHKTSDGSNWWANEIVFPFSSRLPQLPRWGSSEFFNYRKWLDDLEYTCEGEFWKIKQHQENYDLFFSLNIFDNKIFEEEKLSYYQNYPQSYLSKNVWFAYIDSLATHFFPEFRYAKTFSTSKIRRYIVEMKENIWFGFEFDESDMMYELKKGNPVLPDFFNLILVNSQFSKTEKKSIYYYQDHPGIMSLGILGNPFLYHPCYSLIGYNAVEAHRSYELGKPYLKEIAKVSENQYQIIHPKSLNENIKKHAFFYMSLLSSTSHLYLNYLRNVLLKALD